LILENDKNRETEKIKEKDNEIKELKRRIDKIEREKLSFIGKEESLDKSNITTSSEYSNNSVLVKVSFYLYL
jgi:hypothetical protein